MLAYHATKRKEDLEAILATSILIPGQNVSSTEKVVHISRTPFQQGKYGLDVIGPVTNEAWIIKFEILDETLLQPDPSGESKQYSGQEDSWVVHKGSLSIQVVEVTHIPNVDAWELRFTLEEYAAWRKEVDAQLESPEEFERQVAIYELQDLSQRLDRFSHLARQ